MNSANDPHLPRVNELPLNLPLMVLGKVLAEAYRVPPEQPMPERLSRIVRQIQLLEEQDDDYA